MIFDRFLAIASSTALSCFSSSSRLVDFCLLDLSPGMFLSSSSAAAITGSGLFFVISTFLVTFAALFLTTFEELPDVVDSEPESVPEESEPKATIYNEK